jgi:hypothetical protein
MKRIDAGEVHEADLDRVFALCVARYPMHADMPGEQLAKARSTALAAASRAWSAGPRREIESTHLLTDGESAPAVGQERARTRVDLPRFT